MTWTADVWEIAGELYLCTCRRNFVEANQKSAMTDPYMQKAIEMAIANVHAGRGGPFASLIVRKGEIIGTGTNRVTSTHDPTAHAEIVAIREACEDLGHYHLTGCDLYTTCEPCPMCLGAVYWARIDRVFYAASREDAAAAGFDDAFIYDELAREPGERRVPMIQVMPAESLRAFQVWREQEDRLLY